MLESLTILDVFLRGCAVGALTIMGLSVWRSSISRDGRIAAVLISVSASAWLMTETPTLRPAFGHLSVLPFGSWAVAGVFWSFVLAVFEDRPLSPRILAPSVVLIILGVMGRVFPSPAKDWLWAIFNLAGGGLALHAGYIIGRGWSGDLLEGRRRVRGLLLGLAAAFATTNVVLAFVARLEPDGPWILFTVARPYGGAFISVTIMAIAAMFLQGRPAVFGPARREPPTSDALSEGADRLMLRTLNELMAAGGWRREGLTIGEVARQLDASEHRVRRLINRRLGHRNFTDFVNSYRIEAAKRRLGDPNEVRTTIAAIAFDLGYGSLGPFNRAFRAATGATPTEWRREALQASPDLREGV